MTFRKQAIITLKSLRSAGYPLQVKLNSSNVSLKAELERLESVLKDECREAEEAIDAALESEQYGVEDAFIAKVAENDGDDELSLTSVAPSGLGEDAIKVAKIASARLVHTVKDIDYRELAAKALLVILYATLYTIKAAKATIKAGRVTAKATTTQRRFLKDMAKAGWNFVKLHPTVAGTHRSEVMETIFCLG